jgi:hypothetical protein
MSFFNGYNIAREQAYGFSAAIPFVPPAPTPIVVGDAWGTPTKMAYPKRKLLLIKRFLEEEANE